MRLKAEDRRYAKLSVRDGEARGSLATVDLLDLQGQQMGDIPQIGIAAIGRIGVP